MRTVEQPAGGRSVPTSKAGDNRFMFRSSPSPAFWPALPTGWHAKGGVIPEGFYVQVRYPHARRWVTLALFDVRPTAAGVAANAYRDRHNGRGETPRQVRVISAGQLRREGGQRDLTIAEADVARGATG